MAARTCTSTDAKFELVWVIHPWTLLLYPSTLASSTAVHNDNKFKGKLLVFVPDKESAVLGLVTTWDSFGLSVSATRGEPALR